MVSQDERFPAVFDSHTHLFSPGVVARVSGIEGLASALCLEVGLAAHRTDTAALKSEAGAAGVTACLLLPTSAAAGVRRVNDLFLGAVEKEGSLLTAGTLHPAAAGMVEEIERLCARGVRAIKLCSFSQGFDLLADETFRLFDMLRAHNASGKPRMFVILDTFCQADRYFGVPRDHLTTPERLGRLVAGFPEIDFVGAHMGGLAAPLRDIEEHLPPAPNLYLETSNASHVLSGDGFLRLLGLHGPERVIFGTDWPWFGQSQEVSRIRALLETAGFSFREQSEVFSGNASRLLGRI